MIDYESLLNHEIKAVKPSGIRKFFDIANEMEDVISLSIGEPDFSTPWHVRQEAIDTLQQGKTWYSPNRGFFELRQEICKWVERKYHVTYHPESEVLVTVGGSEAIDLCIRTLINPGDEVLIPEPSFVCYVPMTEMAKGVPVTIETKMEDNFRLTAKALREKITPKTKLLILPFPNNPTGAIMTHEELQIVADVIKEHDLFVLSDEIYSELSYQGDHVSIAAIPGMKERSVVINGFSKSYAMTGWRLGYAVGPKEIIKQMIKVHQYLIMSAPTTSQYAAIEALRNGDEDVAKMRESYDERRRFLVKELREMGMPCFEPMGAFYVFPNISRFGMTSEEFAKTLLEKEHVAVVPGSAFGTCGEGFLRISYAYSIEDLKKALVKIQNFIDTIS